MSHTLSPGLVDASRWTYVAAVMARILEEAAQSSRVDPASIPAGVHDAAREFFSIVVEVFAEGVPLNPVASAANYCHAARALRESATVELRTRAELNATLTRYKDLVDHLGEKFDLDRSEAALCLEVAKFFEQLSLDGETEAYERYTAPSQFETVF